MRRSIKKQLEELEQMAETGINSREQLAATEKLKSTLHQVVDNLIDVLAYNKSDAINNGCYSPTELAKRLGISKSLLFKWRNMGTGPKYFKMGRAVFYPEESLQTWIKERKLQQNTSQN